MGQCKKKKNYLAFSLPACHLYPAAKAESQPAVFPARVLCAHCCRCLLQFRILWPPPEKRLKSTCVERRGEKGLSSLQWLLLFIWMQRGTLHLNVSCTLHLSWGGTIQALDFILLPGHQDFYIFTSRLLQLSSRFERCDVFALFYAGLLLLTYF